MKNASQRSLRYQYQRHIPAAKALSSSPSPSACTLRVCVYQRSMLLNLVVDPPFTAQQARLPHVPSTDEERLICAECNLVFVCPIVPRCGHTVCYDCFTHRAGVMHRGKRKKRCFTCKKLSEVAFPNHVLHDMIESKLQECSNSLCFAQIHPLGMHAHHQMCPHEMQICSYCQYVCTRYDMHTHQLDACIDKRCLDDAVANINKKRQRRLEQTYA